jgi:pimeloyl-ACP methyl ester carboxylesterase
MSTYLLLPGAGGAAWYWHRVANLVRDAGGDVVAIDLPADDPAAGLDAYVDLALAAIDGRDDVVVAAQSMGAFTGVPVCGRVRVERLVLLNAMIPAPGERATAWWDNTGSEDARRAAARAGGWTEEIELATYFLHDVPPDLAAESAKHTLDEADIAFDEPCPFDAWPDVPTTVLAGRDDRFFPVEFQRRVARERLGLDIVELPGGHLNALSEPEAVAGAMLGFQPAHQSRRPSTSWRGSSPRPGAPKTRISRPSGPAS